MAVRKWFRMQNPEFYRDGVFKLFLRRDGRISVVENCVGR